MTLEYGTGSGLSVTLAGPFAGGSGVAAKLSAVSLPADGWKNAESPYFQQVQIEGISVASMVTIQADREQMAQLEASGTAIHIDNDGGVATAYALGAKPERNMTFQVILTEVVAL